MNFQRFLDWITGRGAERLSGERRAEMDRLAKELMLADPRSLNEAVQAYDAEYSNGRYRGTLTQFIREFFNVKYDRGYARLPGYV